MLHANMPEMQSAKLSRAKPGPSTVRFLDISEIRDDVVVLKDGTVRAVLSVSSINFALKADNEQEAIIAAYVGFLNLIDHPVQVMIQSRKFNIEPYLNELNAREKIISNELLRAQLRDYRAFVEQLVKSGEAMSKKFFVVIPFDPVTEKKKNFWTRISEVLSPGAAIKLKEKQFQERKEGLVQRVTNVIGALSAMSLTVTMLDTQTLIELYYSFYNPVASETQKLPDANEVRIEN
jgi:hypothetical protein